MTNSFKFCSGYFLVCSSAPLSDVFRVSDEVNEVCSISRKTTKRKLKVGGSNRTIKSGGRCLCFLSPFVSFSVVVSGVTHFHVQVWTHSRCEVGCMYERGLRRRRVTEVRITNLLSSSVVQQVVRHEGGPALQRSFASCPSILFSFLFSVYPLSLHVQAVKFHGVEAST